ncbi:MAG: hypothetical protein J1E64_12825 [Acetatifactor sp.]|nr:hypothetical protein [Acetatifactor sp.]
MRLEKKLKDYKETVKIVPNEQNIKETVKKSIDAFCFAEQERMLNYWEFLWAELWLIRKRWWFFQLILLSALGAALPSFQGEYYTQRYMGVAASLFIILIIPEFWKSQTYQSMEIESVSYYSLRQIYSARILLFGIVDIVLITFFCWFSFAALDITLSQILVQFIFPMAVTACICFGMLCSKHPFSETVAVMMCTGWSGVWLFIVLNERIYAAIIYPLWFTFLGIALLFVAFTIYRTLYCYNDHWEGNI